MRHFKKVIWSQFHLGLHALLLRIGCGRVPDRVERLETTPCEELGMSTLDINLCQIRTFKSIFHLFHSFLVNLSFYYSFLSLRSYFIAWLHGRNPPDGLCPITQHGKKVIWKYFQLPIATTRWSGETSFYQFSQSDNQGLVDNYFVISRIPTSLTHRPYLIWNGKKIIHFNASIN